MIPLAVRVGLEDRLAVFVDSARKIAGNAIPPNVSPPICRQQRRDKPSQNRDSEPELVSMFESLRDRRTHQTLPTYRGWPSLAIFSSQPSFPQAVFQDIPTSSLMYPATWAAHRTVQLIQQT